MRCCCRGAGWPAASLPGPLSSLPRPIPARPGGGGGALRALRCHAVPHQRAAQPRPGQRQDGCVGGWLLSGYWHAEAMPLVSVDFTLRCLTFSFLHPPSPLRPPPPHPQRPCCWWMWTLRCRCPWPTLFTRSRATTGSCLSSTPGRWVGRWAGLGACPWGWSVWGC